MYLLSVAATLVKLIHCFFAESSVLHQVSEGRPCNKLRCIEQTLPLACLSWYSFWPSWQRTHIPFKLSWHSTKIIPATWLSIAPCDMWHQWTILWINQHTWAAAFIYCADQMKATGQRHPAYLALISLITLKGDCWQDEYQDLVLIFFAGKKQKQKYRNSYKRQTCPPLASTFHLHKYMQLLL